MRSGAPQPRASSEPAPGRGAFHPVVRRIYAQRLGSEEAAVRFLEAALADVPPPGVLPGLSEAADRIEEALRAGERIAVFGHDDPDGITSAALLVETLELLGADPLPYVPDRRKESHGLYPGLVRRFHRRGVTLLVTTDGCTTNRNEADLAASLGMDVIVTDHHEVSAGRPTVPRLVNPKADPVTASAYGDLTGAGVAALLARALLARAGRPDEDFERLLDLVALGTLGDHGDVGRSNRAAVVQGLEDIGAGRRPAIGEARRRLGVADVSDLAAVRRIGAVFASIPSVEGKARGLDALLGRTSWMEDTDALLEAFLRSEAHVREDVARGERAAVEAGVFGGAPAVLRMDRTSLRSLGPIAAHLVKITSRPSAVLVEHAGSLVGELRAPEGVHLVEILGGMRDLLDSWGGHHRAAGFAATPSRSEEITRRLAVALDVPPRPPAPRAPEAEIAGEDIDEALLDSLRAARPFGTGNPPPVFRVGARLLDADELLAGLGAGTHPAPGSARGASAPESSR